MPVSAWREHSPRFLRRNRVAAWATASLVVFSAVASDASGPAPHEFFPPDPAEDMALGATVASGKLPIAVETRSGLVSAPDPVAESLRHGDVYGGAQTASSVDASFRLDRLTNRPEQVHYDSPFRPSIIPFKRLYAFDLVETSWRLGVSDERLRPVPIGGGALDREDVFFADLEVELRGGTPVRIPSVGAGARVVALSVDPPRSVEVLEDGAENWFVRSPEAGRVRLVMQLSVDRRTFGDIYPPVAWSVLAPFRPKLPPEAQAAAGQVLNHIGALGTESPAHALRLLVDYFRRFRDSEVAPDAVVPRDLYLELSLGQKGVCRHRAYAFLVTAQALGIPSRLIHNEAHAWVEVFDGERWLRVDLGGAATRVDTHDVLAEPTPEYRPPPDPYSWPRGGQPGNALAARPRAGVAEPDGDAQRHGSGQAQATGAEIRTGDARSRSRGGDRGAPADSRDPQRSDGANGSSDALGSGEPQDGGFSRRARDVAGPLGALLSLDGKPRQRAEVLITLTLLRSEVKRGAPVSISGRATRGGQACSLSRLDVVLQSDGGTEVVGSVATDRDGYYLGQVTIPRDSVVGAQKLSVRLGAGCQ